MLELEYAAAAELAREAGRLVMDVYGSDFGVDFKTPTDPVTEADQRANELIVRGLRERFSSDGIVAEESPDHGDALSRKRCWFVDPLDGTKEFIAKNGEFSVMIGLTVEGRAVLGAVYQPVHDKLYMGVVGHGASLLQHGTRRDLTVSNVAAPSALGFVGSRSHRSTASDEIVRRLGIVRQTPSGSVGLKVGKIAERDADLYVHPSDRSSKWDACAPDAILRAAGGHFTDMFGADIDYRGAQMANARGILACNAVAFDAVLPVVRAVAIEAGFVERLR